MKFFSEIKKYKVVMKLFGIVLIPFLLITITNYRKEKRKIIDFDVEYHKKDSVAYINQENIKKIILKGFNPNLDIYPRELDWFKIEKDLNANEMIHKAQIYLTIDGYVKVKIDQKEPIARIFDKKDFYYLDLNGGIMPLSDIHSARVPLVFGSVNSQNKKDVFSVCYYIYNDNFLNKYITQITIKDNDLFSFRIRGAKFDVILGNAEDLQLKFENFKAFVHKISKEKKLDKYKEINLKYTNQVVCTKNI